MAEQEVRPQQLSIAEIARLWSAETGDSAEDVERELAEWAYAASADGAQIGLESGSDKKSPAKLKIEPDPRRELCREDLEAFCRESDRLVPHVWPEAAPPSDVRPPLGAKSATAAPEASTPGDAEPARAPRDMSRLVVRAMDRMGSTALAAASRRAPRVSDPMEPAAAAAATPAKPAADKKSTVTEPMAATGQSEKKIAAPGGAESQRAASIEDLDGPRRKPSPNATPGAAKVIRAAKKAPAARQARAPGQKSKLGPLRDITSRAQDVPVKVMGSAPALAAARPDRPASVPLAMIAAAGLLGGALIAAAGGAAWIEFEGPGLEPFFLGQRAAQSELAEMEQRVIDLTARAAKADGESERLSGQLNDTRRQNDTLRARIEDISSLGPRLTDTQKANTELRLIVADLTTALNAARNGGSAAVQAIEKELKSARDALNKANAATQAARNDAKTLTESLAAAQGEIEAGKLARLRLEQERDTGVKTLEAANDEIENLAQSGTAARAVVQRLERDLSASEQQLQAREKDQVKFQAQLAALNKELTETRARAAQLAAAETETRRLGAALDTATLEIARLRTAAELSQRETAELASRLAEERLATARIRTDAKAATEKSQGLARDLALAQTANAELRAEADGLNTQAAQLSEFLATARVDAKTLKADRASAIAKVRDLERDLASFKDESAKLRASLVGTNGASAQLAARLAAAERRAAKLNENRREAVVRAGALAKELETTKKAAAEQGAAQNRVESLVVSMAAAKAEVLNLRAKARQADEKSDLLLEAVDSWKAKARVLTANLATLKGRASLTAASDIRPQAGPSKEALIGAAAASSSTEQKLDTARKASRQAGVSQAALPTAKRDGSAKLMLARGNEYLGRGDIASARLFFVQAAEQGETAALMAVGRTYDPRILSELGVLGAFADPAIATQWYERALAAGDDKASRHLEALRAWRNP